MRAAQCTTGCRLSAPRSRRGSCGTSGAWAATSLGNWAFYILSRSTRSRAGGAAGVGLAAVARMLPAGLRRRSRASWPIAARGATCSAGDARARAGAGARRRAVAGRRRSQSWWSSRPCRLWRRARSSLRSRAAAGPRRTPEQLGAANAVLNGVENVGFLIGRSRRARGRRPGSRPASRRPRSLAVRRFALRRCRAMPRAPRGAGGCRLATEVLAASLVLRERRLRLVVGALAVATWSRARLTS